MGPAALVLVGCVSERALTSADREEQVAAVDALPAWQARRWVPQLEKWALQSSEGRPDLSDAALRALVRADTDPALTVVRAHAEGARNEPAVRALMRVRTRRACDLLAELWTRELVDDRARVRDHLCSAVADDRLPCRASFDPGRDPCPR